MKWILSTLVWFVSLLIGSLAHASYWSPEAVACWEGNGHCYQRFKIYDCASPPYPSWEAARAFAEAQGGYLATLTSEAEVNFIKSHNFVRGGGWLGARLINGSFQWVTGPEAGQPVIFYVFPFIEAQREDCSLFTTLFYLGSYYTDSKDAATESAPYCDFYRCVGEANLLVEFDSTVPVENATWGSIKALYK